MLLLRCRDLRSAETELARRERKSNSSVKETRCSWIIVFRSLQGVVEQPNDAKHF